MNRLQIVMKYMTLKNRNEKPELYKKAQRLKKKIIQKADEKIRKTI